VRGSWKQTFARAGFADRKVVNELFGRYDKEFKSLTENLLRHRDHSAVADIRD
jgi:hypothetical protein